MMLRYKTTQVSVKFDESIKLFGTMPYSLEASKLQGSLGCDSTLPRNRRKRHLQTIFQITDVVQKFIFCG